MDGPFSMPEGGDMDVKGFAAKVKAIGSSDGLEEGQFEAYASVFGNVDSYGDVVVKGAFEKDLTAWKDAGIPIPLLFGHNMEDPDFNIGHIADAKEDDHGLLVKGQLDLESPKAQQVYRLLKGNRINQMSFAYKVLDSGPVEVDGAKAVELRELKLYEISVVPVGANELTEVLAVKAGRVLSAKNAELVTNAIKAADDLKSALKTLLDAATNDDGKASGVSVVKAEEPSKAKDEEPSPAKSEEPSRAKAEEPPARPSVDASALEHYLKSLSLEEIL